MTEQDRWNLSFINWTNYIAYFETRYTPFIQKELNKKRKT